MQRILGLPFCLLGLTAVLFLSAACGQNEGGRCQVTSDCASGLVCRAGETGNGRCEAQTTLPPTTDAALGKDSAEDLPVVSEPDVGPDAVAIPEFDAETVDAGAVD